MGKPFTPERLTNIRRMRKVRRLYKKLPLFAYETMLADYPDYTYDNFWDDLRYRRKPKRRNGKSPLARYGRYRRMEQLKELYRKTANIDYGLKAHQLRRNMTKPYRVFVRIEGKISEYSFSPLVRIEEIERLTADLSKCRTVGEAEETIEHFMQTANLS